MASRSQSTARPSAQPAESKAKQDVVGSKSGRPAGAPARGRGARGGARGGRRREPVANAAPFTGAAANPRRNPPRGGGRAGRGKQPLARGYQGSNQRFSVAEEDEFQVGSVFNSGSKKQSLNHLLNFQYSPRGNGPESDRRSRGLRAPPRGNKPVYRQTFSKEQYLQSNCQFIVDGGDDYSANLVDPDIQVDWEKIQEVYLKSSGSEPTSCPICLFPPTAGKISRCGHVFCWPCILHYLALSDDDWRKCPICYENIHKTELKSVQAIQQPTLGTGSTIEMRLMKRERNSTLAVPVQHPGLSQLPWVSSPPEDKALSKIIRATPEQVLETILSREQVELERQLREEEQEPEAVFIREALMLLQERRDKCLAMRGLYKPLQLPEKAVNTSAAVESELLLQQQQEQLNVVEAVDPFEDLQGVLDALPVDTAMDNQPPKVVVNGEAEGERPRHMSTSSDNSSSEGEEETTVTAEDLDIASLQPPNLSQDRQAPKTTFYFYQDKSGQRIFLHALNLQMLVKEFGSIEMCPTTIKARIVEKDSSTMTDELRDRLRYLRHLPVSSSFEVAELDLSQVVSKATLAAFRDQIEDRKRKRERKRRAEKVREKRIHREEMRIMGRFPSPMARIESAYHYPSIGAAAPPPTEAASGAAGGPETVGSTDLLDSFPEAVTLSQQEASRQAAATAGQASGGGGGAWKSGGAAVESASLNFASIAKQVPTVQQKPAAPSSRPTNSNGMVQLGGSLPVARTRLPGSESDPEPEGYIRAPPAASLGDVFAQALARAPQPQAATAAAGHAGKKKGKKSRGTPILLTGGGVPQQQRSTQ